MLSKRECLDIAFRQALEMLCISKPPSWASLRLPDERFLELQTWAVSNAKYNWMTGIAILEAAELLAIESSSNDMIEFLHIMNTDKTK